MKIKKIISALLASAMIFGMSALAADVKFDDAVTYTAGAETVTVNLYPNGTYTTIDAYCCVAVAYDMEIYSVKEATTLQESSTAADYGEYDGGIGTVQWSNDQTSTTSVIDQNKPLMTVVFNVLDPDKVVGSKFEVMADLSYIGSGSDFYMDFDASVTVTTGKPASNVSAAIDANDVITVTGDSALAGKKLVVSETTCSTVTANTRVKVTLGDDYKIFGEYMWAEGGIEGPGSLQGKTVAFGVIFEGNYVADDFTFEIIPDITTYNAN